VLAQAEAGHAEQRERMRELAVALFAELGSEHPLTARYRRRLATLVY
jgi:thioredoxin-like negative regulator of GroEL